MLLPATTSMAELNIRERFLSAESELLSAVGDQTAVENFRQKWASTSTAFNRAARTGHLNLNLASLAHSTATRVEILSNQFADFHRESQAITATLNAAMDGIFAKHTHHQSDSFNNDGHDNSTLRSSLGSSSPCPPYIASAYKWLRHNLHKPYPTVEEVKSICANSNTSEKRIRNWFISARQRMGWTKIAKQHFHSDKEDTADAAYRALIEPDPKRPIDAKLIYEFVKMQVAAEGMYSTAFKPSLFAGSLGTTVVGMSTEHKACIEQMRQQAIEEENIRKEVDHQMKRQRVSKRKGSQRRSVSLYPSPEPSPGGSPEPTLVFSETEDDEMDMSQSSVAAGRKRRRSSSSDQLDFHIDKRPRSATAASPVDPSISLPSPPASAEENILDYWASEVSPIDSNLSTPPAASRKRRLSDADAQGPPKHLRGLAVGPRVHAVSDPLPMSGAVMQALELENWNVNDFEFKFDFPSAATSQPLDPLEPIDVELFTNWATGVASAGNSSNPIMNSASPIAGQQVDLPLSELISSSVPAFDMSGSAGTDYHQFLHDLDMLSQPTQPKVMAPSPSFPTTILQASLQQSESIGVSNDDWSMYLESVPPANSPTSVSSSQPHGFIDFSAIPDFDPSMLKPPSPPSPAEIIAQSEAATKRAKLEQWRAHLDAAKKLEEELTTTT